ncbi:UvrD-helicase domain-containing protein [Thermopolyspora sp. NPDC052614]|uniref:HelD family protein n=1 Tax=Thermopolyspora sp. NPDC052614 TaxID=3155682 RepID=UPI003440E75C
MSNSEIEREQEYVQMLYRRVDELREQASQRLATVLREHGGTRQALVERESAYRRYADRVAKFDAAENGLCFGRLDLSDGRRHYIGRIGILDDSGDPAHPRAGEHAKNAKDAQDAKDTEDAKDAEDAEDRDPLLIDWRAPAARPFYVATAAAPEGVRRRRHITLRGRRVVALDDEILDRDAVGAEEGLTGEAALLAAVNAGRTGRMRDIVETLQAEQDEIIRSDHRGVLVVQGGPGTGKTAVALHRAAYLLYTHRHLAARGVLVVGPNATFLRYIGQVLPGLGETSVLLSTVGELFPGVVAGRPEPPETAEIKGRAVMAEVLAAAVRDRQAVPRGTIEIQYGRETLRLEEKEYVRAAERARGPRTTHNQARRVFLREIVDVLTRQVAERMESIVLDENGEPLDGGDPTGALSDADKRALIAAGFPRELIDDGLGDGQDGAPLLDEADLAELRKELIADPAVRAALNELWPALTPQRLLRDLFADPDRLAVAAPMLGEDERALLLRAPGDGWSTADVPLLDEAAELLGEVRRPGLTREEAERAEQIAYAQGVLDITIGSRSSDLEEGEEGEILTAADVIDARELAERHETGDARTLAERAAADRSWTFGHIIVDEAQELSQMAWRVLMRRCPTRSMTIVGDVAQTGDAAGTSSWARVLRPHVGDRWRLARLTVNYRTPAEIMDAATGVLALLADGPAEEPDAAQAPRSVRETGVPPWRLATTPEDLPTTLAEHAARELTALDEGRLAVIVPDARLAELGEAVAAAIPGAAYGPDPDLESGAVVLGVRQAKGLEFDAVLIADPAAILDASPRGRNDLYVAMTRATQRLGIIHPGPPPAAIAIAIPERAATTT